MPVTLDAPLVHGTSELFLKSRYDNPQPTPTFHQNLWEECCSDEPYVALAAPRGHAKSTAVTHAYGITSLLFRTRSFALLVSDTEGQAVQFLQDIKVELTENEPLIEQFEIKKLVKDTESDLIVEFKDGEQFRIIAKGSEQKVRGLKWRNRRPDLIVCHEKGTEIFADGRWIKNQDHPTAMEVKASGYRVTFEDGTIETVSKDHRYWVESIGWVFADNLKPGMEVGGCSLLMTKEEQEIASITEGGELTIRRRLRLSRLRIVNAIKKLFIKGTKSG